MLKLSENHTRVQCNLVAHIGSPSLHVAGGKDYHISLAQQLILKGSCLVVDSSNLICM